MQASEVPRAVAAAMSTASSLDLKSTNAIVLHDSNKLALRLLPCDVLARVAPIAHQVAQFEVELAQRLAETESPVSALEPRVEPAHGKIRWSYPVVWNEPGVGEMRFHCFASAANEEDGLSFQDWIPLDAETWSALGRLQ